MGGNVEMFEALAEKLGEYKKEHPEASTDYQLYGGDETPSYCHCHPLDETCSPEYTSKWRAFVRGCYIKH